MGTIGNLNFVKNEIRVLGIDDGPFGKNQKKVPVFGVVFRGNSFLDSVLSATIDKDGLDSTDKLLEMINNSRQKSQLRAIMLDGISLGGFNIIDIEKLSRKTDMPVIVVIRRMPNLAKMKTALKKFEDFNKRISLLENAGEVFDSGKIFFQCFGIAAEKAREIIKKSTKIGNMPEPIRVAHIIASGVVLGDSHGRA